MLLCLLGVMLRFVLYIRDTFRIIYLQLFVLYICNFSYYIFATFRIIYLQLFVLYICNFSYYIFATFRIIYLRLFVLYICNFSYYIFATFRIIYLQLFILYFCNFSYYIFDTLRIIYLQLRIIKSHFRIIKLGYVLKIYVRIVNNKFVYFSLLARHTTQWFYPSITEDLTRIAVAAQLRASLLIAGSCLMHSFPTLTARGCM